MKIERYQAYKDSGVEWLGNVPKHWEEKRVKDIAILERGKFTHRPRNDPQMYDGIHPFIQTGDVARAVKYVTTYKQTLSDRGITISKWFPKGTLVMAIAANIGDVAIVDFDTYFPDSIVAYKPRKNNTDYLFYLFSATKHELGKVKVTSTQDNLNLERLNSLIKFIPLLPEQKTIAHYLDTKTAQIDRKIDLLTQKATLYANLKQSLINETVTRGLDQSVPMKDSGIEWIGEVPEHWAAKRIKDLSFLQSGNNITSEQIEDEGEYPVFGGNGLRGYFSRYTNDGDYILIGRQGALCGNINYASGKFWATEHAVVVYLHREVDMRWYGAILKVMNLNQYSISAAQPGLAVERIKRLLLSVSSQTELFTQMGVKFVKLDQVLIRHNFDDIYSSSHARKSTLAATHLSTKPPSCCAPTGTLYPAQEPRQECSSIARNLFGESQNFVQLV